MRRTSRKPARRTSRRAAPRTTRGRKRERAPAPYYDVSWWEMEPDDSVEGEHPQLFTRRKHTVAAAMKAAEEISLTMAVLGSVGVEKVVPGVGYKKVAYCKDGECISAGGVFEEYGESPLKGMERNTVGAGFRRWTQAELPVGTSVVFKQSTFGVVVGDDGDTSAVPVPKGVYGTVSEHGDDAFLVHVEDERFPEGTVVVLGSEGALTFVDPVERATVPNGHVPSIPIDEFRGYMRRNASRGGTRRVGRKDLRKLIRLAEKQGWEVERTKSGHLKFVPPDPEQPMVFTHTTASDWRAVKNLRARLRRAGLRLNG